MVRFFCAGLVFLVETDVSIGDHIFGLIPLLAARLDGAGGMADGALDVRLQAGISATDVPVSKKQSFARS